jgi:hypothetical protein
MHVRERVAVRSAERVRILSAVQLSALLFALVSTPASAQQAPAVTAADYERAESFLRDKVLPLVSGMSVQPLWLSGDRFGYRTTVGGRTQFILVDPSKGTRVPCSPETDRCGGALDPREIARLQMGTQRLL